MSRPVTIRDEDLLAAARAEFLAQGIRATTAEIAKRAGVSEGTLFKRFNTKEELFHAAMNVEPDGGGPEPIGFDLRPRTGKDDIETVLVELGTYLTEKFVSMMPMMMMKWANVASSERGFTGPPPQAVRGTRMLADYLAAEMKLGRVRKHDPEVMALTFSGAMWQYAFFHTSSNGKPWFKVSRKEYVRGVVAGLWSGLAPKKRLGANSPMKNERAQFLSEHSRTNFRFVEWMSEHAHIFVAMAGFLVAREAACEPSLGELTAAARARSFDAREGAATLQQRALEADRAWEKLLPTVTATGDLVRNQYASIVHIPTGAGGETRTAVITPLNQRDLVLTATLPLVDLGTLTTASAAAATRNAERARSAATGLTVEQNVTSTYYSWIGATEVAASARKNHAAAEENRHFVATRAGAGVATTLDEKRAEAEVARTAQTIADADYNAAILARSLETQTGLTVAAAPALAIDDLHDEAPLPTWLGTARDRPLAVAARLDGEAAEKNARASRALLLPTLSAQGSERFTNATGFGTSPAYALSLVATWRLDAATWAGADAQVAAAEVSKVRAERAARAAEDEVFDAFHKVTAQIEKARAARAERMSSEVAVTLAKERYAAGTGTFLDLVQAKRDDFSAEVVALQADADLAAARASLRIVSGRSAGAP